MKFIVEIEQTLDYTNKIVSEFDDLNKALDFMYVMVASCKNSKVSISAEEIKPE